MAVIDSDSSTVTTPTKCVKRAPSEGSEPSTSSPKKSKSTPKKSPEGKGGEWTPDLRMRLFDAYQEEAGVRWENVAQRMDAGMSAKQCRDQWHRGMGAKIKKALSEK